MSPLVPICLCVLTVPPGAMEEPSVFDQVKEILQEEEDLSEIVQLVGKVRILMYCYDGFQVRA